jgi:hypothetical protein
MKTTFWILFTLFMIIYSSEPTIKFKPFSISFESPYVPFALFFLFLSISFFSIHYQKKGVVQGYSKAYKLKLEEVQSGYGAAAYEKGFKDGCEAIYNEIEKRKKEKN